MNVSCMLSSAAGAVLLIYVARSSRRQLSAAAEGLSAQTEI